jgi:Rieske 2Fe-2S family protein
MIDYAKIELWLAARPPGCSLPQALYESAEAYAFDLEAIFARSWLTVGFEAELPRPGAWMATSIGPWPIIITRARDGALYAFHNACRHRGAQICRPGKGVSSRLVCPYHRWTYELSGELVHAARMGESFDPAAHGLGTIHVRSVGGVLYVCLAPQPPSIDPFQAAFEPLIAPHGFKRAKLAHESILVEKANWKLVMENARECYHCAGSHPELARSFPTGASAHFDFGEDRRQEAFAARMAAAGLGVGPVEGDWWQAMRFTLNEGCRSMTLDGGPAVRRLMCESAGGDIGSLRWASEPHAFGHATADQAFLFYALPLGPKETLVTAKWLVHEDAVEGVDYELEALIELWTRTNLQDRDLVENNQIGVSSLGYRPGPYSAHAEALALRFTNWYCAAAHDHIEAQGLSRVSVVSRRGAA